MLSIPHLIIIFVVALIVFGPEKLPELAKNLGKVMAEFKRATGEFRMTLDDQLRELEREAEQRRIGGAKAPLPIPAEGIVANSPPQTPAEASAPPPPAEPGTPEAAATEQPTVPASEPNREIVSDGRARPA
jgi:sec-independent protein translocase protein TatB